MEITAKLSDLLNQTMQREPELKAWRFNIHDAKGLEVGLKNNQIGGPYSAPSYKRSITGDIYLIWQNQRFTSAKLDSQVVDSFDEYLNLWKTTVYYDSDGVGLFNPEQIPDVPLTDAKARQIVERDFQFPFQILDQGLKRLLEYGMSKVDGKIRCYQDHRVLKNSDGLTVDYFQTPVEFYFEVNDSYGESFQEKRLPTKAEVNRIIENTGHIGEQLLKPASADISGPIQLILAPTVFESFFNHFVIANLFGSLVVNRQSSFALEDFHNKRQVLRNDLSLEINTLLPLKSFSYPCTTEAVPGGSIRLIADGQLQTPILSLKYAKKTGFNPTPIPVGGRGFFIKSNQAMNSWDELIQKTEYGLIVYSVLGLHTQDSSSGHFSLTADQCLLVKNGEIAGKIKAIINGDFLGSLKKETSEFAVAEGEDNPGYLFVANAAM
jgi:PmbA protein